MDRPFTFLLFPFILGILVIYFFEVTIKLAMFLMILLLLYLLYNIIKNDLNQRLLFLLFFILAMLLTIRADRSQLVDCLGQNYRISGLVDEVLFKDHEKARYIVIVDRIDKEFIGREKIALTIMGQKDISLGSRLDFTAKLKLPDRNTNPKLYNYRLNLKSNRIHTRASIKENNINFIDEEGLTLKYRVKAKVTRDIENLFTSHLEGHNADLITGIILGKSAYLDEETVGLYRGMGLAHILAVSGLHIGVISGFIFFVLSRLGVKRRTNIFLTLVIIWAYGFLIDFPTSILRANIMFSLLFYSQLIHEPYDSLNTLSFAALILLIINPFYLFNIGFQLSFMASLSIVLLYPRVASLFYPNKNWLTETLSVLLGLNIGLIPIQVYYFNSISLLSIIANILLVPLLSFSLILGLLMIIFLYSLPFLNIFLGYLLNLFLSIQFIVVKYLDRIPFNTIKVFSPDIVAIIFYYIIILIIFGIIDISKLKYKYASFLMYLLSITICFNLFLLINEDFLEIHFIDVGQGDAIYIRSKDANYLMDSGGSFFSSFDIGRSITLPYLEKLGVKELDAVFISHFHEDHCQGLYALFDEIKINHLMSSYHPKDEKMSQAIKEQGLPHTVLKRGDRVELGKQTSLDIVWPYKDSHGQYDENNMSLVGLLKYKDFTILLTGDLEKEGELQIYRELPKVDIIKVPHHGSSTSSTEELLRSLKPRYGFISVGRDNIYNHPSFEVINRYEDFGTELYRTDENGLIVARIDNLGVTIGSFLENGERVKLRPIDFLDRYSFEFIFYIIYGFIVYLFIRIRFLEGSSSGL